MFGLPKWTTGLPPHSRPPPPPRAQAPDTPDTPDFPPRAQASVEAASGRVVPSPESGDNCACGLPGLQAQVEPVAPAAIYFQIPAADNADAATAEQASVPVTGDAVTIFTNEQAIKWCRQRCADWNVCAEFAVLKPHMNLVNPENNYHCLLFFPPKLKDGVQNSTTSVPSATGAKAAVGKSAPNATQNAAAPWATSFVDTYEMNANDFPISLMIRPPNRKRMGMIPYDTVS